jgi:hypothetical protein
VHRRLPTAALLALAVAVAACSDAVSPPAQGAVTGRFGHVGGPTPGSPGYYSEGTVTLTGSGRSYTVRISTDGTFRLTVRPGSYQAEGRTPAFDGGKYPCPAGRVEVHAGRTSSLRIYCQLR